MIKKILKYSLAITLFSIVIYLPIFQLQNYLISKTIEKNFLNSGVTSNDYRLYKTIRCNNNFLKPKVAFVNDLFYNERSPEYNIYMFDIINSFSSKIEEIRTGATTIKNTNFDELVTMVERDCFQFQKAKGNPNDDTINWSYGEAEAQEERDLSNIDIMLTSFDYYSDSTKEIFIKVYGDMRNMNGYEILEIYNKILNKGLDSQISEQINIEEEAYKKKIESGDIKINTTEETLRGAGLTEEDIKIALESINEEYVGTK